MYQPLSWRSSSDFYLFLPSLTQLYTSFDNADRIQINNIVAYHNSSLAARPAKNYLSKVTQIRTVIIFHFSGQAPVAHRAVTLLSVETCSATAINALKNLKIFKAAIWETECTTSKAIVRSFRVAE